MARKKRLNTSEKVRYLYSTLMGYQAVVDVMKAASPSSLKRWQHGRCKPIRAHVDLVDRTYQMAKDMGERMLYLMERNKRNQKNSRRK